MCSVCCRYWVFLARDLAQALTVGSSLEGSLEFKKHVVKSYCKRLQEMDLPIGRLALLLDPRYRRAVLSADDDGSQKRVLFCMVR